MATNPLNLSPEELKRRRRLNIYIAVFLGIIAILGCIYPFIYLPEILKGLVAAGG